MNSDGTDSGVSSSNEQPNSNNSYLSVVETMELELNISNTTNDSSSASMGRLFDIYFERR